MVKKEFPTPLTGLADQVQKKLKSILFLFFTSFKSYEKIYHCHFIDNKFFIMMYIEVLVYFVEHEWG